MIWNKFSLYAMGVPDRMTSDSATWRNIFGFKSFWLGLWLFLFITLTSVAILLLRKYRNAEPVDDAWREISSCIKSADDSPFFAYLGHNILTESCAQNPSNTSFHAIDRLPEHLKLRNTPLTKIFEEPQEYDIVDTYLFSPSSPPPRYRSYTYPDTNNKQIRLDHVERMHDPADDRRWQRRTMHVYAI